MITVANIALVVALLVTGMLLLLQSSNAQLKGPDRAGAAIVYFMFTPFRWIALAVALGVVIGEGGFDWITGSAAAQAILVYLVHIGAGAASVMLLGATGDATAPRSAKLACAAISYLLPLALIAYSGWALNNDLLASATPMVMRAVLLGALGLGVLTGLMALASEMRKAARRAEERAAAAGQQEEQVSDRMAQLQALSDESPLQEWLDFTGGNEPSHVQMHALARVAARPTLVADLAALLAGDRAIEALGHVRWHLADRPAVLALPIRDALLRVAEKIRWRVENHETPFPGQFELEVGQAVELAERFHGPEADFRPALAATRDVLDLVAGRVAAPEHRPHLDAWLSRH